MAKIRGDMKRIVARAWLGWAIGKDLLALKGKEYLVVCCVCDGIDEEGLYLYL